MMGEVVKRIFIGIKQKKFLLRVFKLNRENKSHGDSFFNKKFQKMSLFQNIRVLIPCQQILNFHSKIKSFLKSENFTRKFL
jgi:hypothetical protein